MTFATLRIDLRVVLCASPKDRHRQMRSILETIHTHFNVAVAEGEEPHAHDQAVLFAAAVARTRREALEILERVADAVSAHPRAEVLHVAISEA
ncbi:MAG: DUF503 family protein [Isosphaeraceae bacterium]